MSNTATFTFTFNLNIAVNVNVPVLTYHQEAPVERIIAQPQARNTEERYLIETVPELYREAPWYEMFESEKEKIDWQKSGF